MVIITYKEGNNSGTYILHVPLYIMAWTRPEYEWQWKREFTRAQGAEIFPSCSVSSAIPYFEFECVHSLEDTLGIR